MDGFLTRSKCNSTLTNAWCRSLVANRITNRKRIKCTSLRGLKIILACTDTQSLHNPSALVLLCLVSIFFIIIGLCPLGKGFDCVCLFVCLFVCSLCPLPCRTGWAQVAQGTVRLGAGCDPTRHQRWAWLWCTLTPKAGLDTASQQPICAPLTYSGTTRVWSLTNANLFAFISNSCCILKAEAVLCSRVITRIAFP